MNDNLIEQLIARSAFFRAIGADDIAKLLDEARAAIERQSVAQPQPVQESEYCDPSSTIYKLAEMVMSDCGCSSDHQRLLDRIAARIQSHIDTTPQAQPQPVTHDALRCAVGNCTFNGEVDSHAPGCPSALAQPQPVQEQCPECDGTGTVSGSQAHFLCPLCTSPQAAQPLTEADPFTYVIQHLNSSPYALTKDECITKIKELRALYQAQGEAK